MITVILVKLETVKLKTIQVQYAYFSERIKTAGLLICVGGATERFSGKKDY